ncbi:MULTISPECIES: glycosyltransferase [Heyndrickxia]|uniref:glycosyltransferase n=1 Tax=Heyndrickxia TaxID=2837504 RepID=UPI002DB7DD38|nr:glycosyltransferase [Weizmannia sp. CD-2023]MEC2306270.1 glycosyltransferase [Weizmannia sp. CD-2023]MEC2340579.1 glycosyltransferase [Weizmannia sp. CD-2023]
MHVLVVQESRMFIDEKGKYYKVSINKQHYARYFQFAPKIRLLMRTKKINGDEVNNMNCIDLENFEVISCPSIMSPKNFFSHLSSAMKIIENEVKLANYIVLKLPGWFGNIAAYYCKKYNKPYLAELGGCPWDGYWNHSFIGKVVAPIIYLQTKKTLRDTTHALYVTKHFLQNRYPTQGKSISCSNVTLQETDKFILEKRHRHIDENEGKKLIIGTTADLDVKFKGQQYIIKALGKLKKENKLNFEYQLVGRGDSSYLLKCAEKCGVSNEVKIIGPLSHEKVYDWLDTIDIYAQPSRQEGLPRALIEAMSRGITSIGAMTAGIPELLDDKFLFSNTKKNIKEICDILDFIANKNILHEQANRNYNEAQNYRASLLNDRRKKFYEDFIQYTNSKELKNN